MKVKELNFEEIEKVPFGITLEEISEEQIYQIIKRFNLKEEDISNELFSTTVGYDVVTALSSQRDVKISLKKDEIFKKLIFLYSPSLKQAVLSLVDI